MQASSICLTELTATQIGELVASLSEPDYRAGQLRRWLYQRLAASFNEMTDLPIAFRQKLAQGNRLHCITPVHEVVGHGGTVKILFVLTDGKTIEATFMPYYGKRDIFRSTLCLSSQVGCPIGCPFCATGQQGFERNLTPGEMIDQVLYFARRLRYQSSKLGQPAGYITNLVFMGMGEPFANYANLWQAIEMLNSPQGFGLGARSMLISSSGLVPQIKRISRESMQVRLSISIHASENMLRNKLVPINKKYPLEQLIPACWEYVKNTGRRLGFEYVLFDGINDSVYQARSLAQLLGGLDCHVNLILANHTTDQDFRPPRRSTVLTFQAELKRLHINCTLRQGMGLDINAGCGQLHSRLYARPKTQG